jgi:dihydrofolate reductase
MNSMTSPPVPLVIAAAVARNGAIGRGNRLPWRMPGDLAHFRDITMGKPMIMGRLTYESIGRVLPGRDSIVVTRAAHGPPAPGLFYARDPDEALRSGQERAAAMGADEIMLIGGAQLFAALMPRARRLRLTFVDLAPEADVFFPAIDPALWQEEARHVPARHPGDEAACVFVDFRRRA